MFIMCGAQIVEMCSAVMAYGYKWIGKQVRALEKFMIEKGYETVDQMRGVASNAALPYADMPHEKAILNPEYCTNCKRCLKACFYQAMHEGSKHTWIQDYKCVGCGGCYSVCPVPGALDIITLNPMTEQGMNKP